MAPTSTELLLTIQANSGVPIYRQVREQITRMVASGHLKAGDSLPSVRQIATNFAVNPMTISKAYSLLEEDGVLERVRGVGMKVAHRGDLEQGLDARLKLIQPALETLVTQIKELQIPGDEVLKAVKKKLEESL